MSLSDLRKELKGLRKETMPTPVSRMSKVAVATELERLRGLSRTATAKKVEETPSAPVVLEKVAKKVVEKKEEKPKKVKEEKPVEEKQIPSKYIKGSAEARERMAMIRSKKGQKKQDE